MTDYTLSPEQQCMDKNKHYPIQPNMKKKSPYLLCLMFHSLFLNFQELYLLWQAISVLSLCRSDTAWSVLQTKWEQPQISAQETRTTRSVTFYLISHHTQKAFKKKKGRENRKLARGRSSWFWSKVHCKEIAAILVITVTLIKRKGQRTNFQCPWNTLDEGTHWACSVLLGHVCIFLVYWQNRQIVSCVCPQAGFSPEKDNAY